MAVAKGRKSLANATKTLKVGDVAPEINLKSHTGEEFKLSNVKGKKNVVVAFFPFAFTPV